MSLPHATRCSGSFGRIRETRFLQMGVYAMNQYGGKQRGQQVVAVIGQRKIKLLGEGVTRRAAFTVNDARKGLRQFSGFLYIAAQGMQRSAIFAGQPREHGFRLVLEFQELENIQRSGVTDHIVCTLTLQSVCADHVGICANGLVHIQIGATRIGVNGFERVTGQLNLRHPLCRIGQPGFTYMRLLQAQSLRPAPRRRRL